MALRTDPARTHSKSCACSSACDPSVALDTVEQEPLFNFQSTLYHCHPLAQATGRIWWDAAMDADAAAGEDAALAVDDDGGPGGDRDGGDGGWCNAAVDLDAADESGEGWWDVATVVNTAAVAASRAECEAQCDCDEDEDDWFDVIAN